MIARIIPQRIFQRGEAVSFRVVLNDDVSLVTVLPTADMKPMAYGTFTLPGDDVAVVASFTISAAPASSEYTAGWMMTLTGVQSKDLPIGRYVTDFRYEPPGSVQITEPVVFRIVNSITVTEGVPLPVIPVTSNDSTAYILALLEDI